MFQVYFCHMVLYLSCLYCFSVFFAVLILFFSFGFLQFKDVLQIYKRWMSIMYTFELELLINIHIDFFLYVLHALSFESKWFESKMQIFWHLCPNVSLASVSSQEKLLINRHNNSFTPRKGNAYLKYNV